MYIGNKTVGTPYSICIIGRDDSADIYSVLYTDDRGVSRVYQMSFTENEWKQWRSSPGFSQRLWANYMKMVLQLLHTGKNQLMAYIGSMILL